MTNRVTISVDKGTGVIHMKVVDKTLSMRREEAAVIAQQLVWAVNASAEETDIQNARMRLKEKYS